MKSRWAPSATILAHTALVLTLQQHLRASVARGLFALKTYPRSLTKRERKFIKPHLLKRGNLRHQKWKWKTILNALLYVLRTGCKWRELPNSFPPCLNPKMHRPRRRQSRRSRHSQSNRIQSTFRSRNRHAMHAGVTRRNWARVIPCFSYPAAIRRAVYITNANECD